jgi:hypothetical protein
MSAGTLAAGPRHVHWMGSVIALLAILVSTSGWACSPAEIQHMKRSGMSDTRIRQICLPALMRSDDPRQTARVDLSTNLCRTRQQVCMLNQRGRPGQICWCNTAIGPQRGELIDH